MKPLHRNVLLLVAFLCGAQWAVAQTDMPRDGACFYRDTGYRGTFFCVPAGQSMDNLPGGFNDEIRSIRIVGNAETVVYNDNKFGGVSTSFRSDVPDLRVVAMATDASRNWAGRISSVQVLATRRDGDYRWDQGQTAGTGACFFEHPNFIGRSFCLDRGKSLENLPPGFNDGVQSIRVVGDSEIQIFSESNFGGMSGRTRRDIPELRAWSIPDNPSRKWGERIASVRIAAPRRDDGDDRRGGENHGLVRCNSQPGDRQQYCGRGYIREAYMINAYGTCRKNVSWGIDDGRLWVSNGCSAEFDVRQ